MRGAAGQLNAQQCRKRVATHRSAAVCTQMQPAVQTHCSMASNISRFSFSRSSSSARCDTGTGGHLIASVVSHERMLGAVICGTVRHHAAVGGDKRPTEVCSLQLPLPPHRRLLLGLKLAPSTNTVRFRQALQHSLMGKPPSLTAAFSLASSSRQQPTQSNKHNHHRLPPPSPWPPARAAAAAAPPSTGCAPSPAAASQPV